MLMGVSLPSDMLMTRIAQAPLPPGPPALQAGSHLLGRGCFSWCWPLAEPPL